MAGDLHLGFFVLTVALMSVHELDAMQRHEWRIFPGLSRLPDGIGMLVFVWAHVPLFALVFWFGADSINAGGNGFSAGFCVFCVAHAFVHWAYERHSRCEFKNPLSRSIIWACALAGLASLVAFCWNHQGGGA
jgi:hypothetical protein